MKQELDGRENGLRVNAFLTLTLHTTLSNWDSSGLCVITVLASPGSSCPLLLTITIQAQLSQLI